MKKQKWDYISEEDISGLSSDKIPYTEESQRMIHQRFLDKRKKIVNKKKRRIGIIISLAAMLFLICLVGFTNRNRLAPIFRQVFGLQGNQLVERINTTNLTDIDEDQGIKMKALSTFQDGGTTYFIYTLTDTTGNRLDKNMLIDRWTMLNGGNTSVIDYDPQTKTATLLVQAVSMEGEKGEEGYRLERLLSKYYEETVTLPELDLAGIIPKKAEWFGDEERTGGGGGYDEKSMEKFGLDFDKINEFLVPMQVNQTLISNPNITLSSIGYKEGLLHIQIKIPNQINFEAAFLSLVHRKTGKKVPFVYDIQVDNGTHNNDTGRSDFTEAVFDIAEDELKNYELEINYFGYNEKIEGDWEIVLKQPERLPERSLPDMDVKMKNKMVELKNLKLSPLSVSYFVAHSVTKKELDTVEVVVLLKDGKKIKMDERSIEQTSKGWNVRCSGGYLDEKQVQAVEINGQQIDISKD